jgi:hypothetical protein
MSLIYNKKFWELIAYFPFTVICVSDTSKEQFSMYV